MANFLVTSATSVYSNGYLIPAFSSDSPSADALTVESQAFLIANADETEAVVLSSTGAWRVTVNGSIYSRDGVGLLLQSGNAASSTIVTGADGEIGGLVGIAALSGGTITNSGEIVGSVFAVQFGGAGIHTLRNQGTITCASTLPNRFAVLDTGGVGTELITNSGTIVGDMSLGGGNDSVTNTGFVRGDIEFGTGSNVLANTGSIIGSVTFENNVGNNSTTNAGFIEHMVARAGTHIITNTGTIAELHVSSVALNNIGIIQELLIESGNTSDVARITNRGVIEEFVLEDLQPMHFVNYGVINDNVGGSGAFDVINNYGTINSVFVYDGNDILFNGGTIIGDCNSTGDDTSRITNTGRIGGSVVGVGHSADVVVNSGIIEDDVRLGRGNDVLTNTGRILGDIFLFDGDDTFIGGNYVETVRDGDGIDTYRLAGGNDVFEGAGSFHEDGNDYVDGGAGIDTYDVSSASVAGGTAINIDAVAHDFSPGFPGVGTVAANTAFGDGISSSGDGSVKDTIIGFENVVGGTGSDIIYGSSVANILKGNGASDSLFGFGGNDILEGGAGVDGLAGGMGKDILRGGADADFFFFLSTAESGVGKSSRDVIDDFQSGLDKIDLRSIDANVSASSLGDQAFNYVGMNVAFGGSAGELRSYWTATGHIIEGDVNGDRKADFSI